MLLHILIYIVVWIIVSFPFSRQGTGISRYVIPAGLTFQILLFYYYTFASYLAKNLSAVLFILCLPMIVLLIIALSSYAAQKYTLFFRASNLLLFIYVFTTLRITRNDSLSRSLGLETEIADAQGLALFLVLGFFTHTFLTLFVFAFYKSINPKYPIYYDVKFGKYRLSQILPRRGVSLQEARKAGLKTLTPTEALTALIKIGLVILVTWAYTILVIRYIV